MSDSQLNLKPVFIAATAFLAAIVILAFGAFGPAHPWMAYVSGALASASFATCSCATGGSRGEDGRFSSSKLQFIIWTTAFLFALFAMLTRTLPDSEESLRLPAEVPGYLLGAMGLSSLTLVGAKGIAANQVNQGNRPAPAVERAARANGGPKGGFFTGDDGDTSLTKVQMLFFNALSAGIFVILTLRHLEDIPAGIKLKWPDIDPTLLMLCGLGNATYVGRKLVPATEPTISKVSPRPLTPGSRVTLRGANFGRQCGLVLLGDREIRVPDTDWSVTAVTFTVPPPAVAGESSETHADDEEAGVEPDTIGSVIVIERADGLASQPFIATPQEETHF